MKQHKLILKRKIETNSSQDTVIVETKVFLKKKLLNKYIEHIKNGYIPFPEFGITKDNVHELQFEIISELVQLKCACCNKNIEGDYKIWDTVDKNKIDKGITHGQIDKGLTEIITPGYGSIYDLSHFLLAICDNCITEKLKTGQMYFLGDQFTQV